MFETPTQYAVRGDGLVIVVGHPESKTWWRNFIEPADIDVRVAGRWRRMTGRVVRGELDPETAGPLLEAYLARFPRAERALAGSTHDERVRSAVVVWCRPR